MYRQNKEIVYFISGITTKTMIREVQLTIMWGGGLNSLKHYGNQSNQCELDETDSGPAQCVAWC